MLHNPHIGLTTTLEKLYHLGKFMADCVVPQEYGTTIAEKRSIGTKMCGALLEKIKHDLIIARTDNQTDMRYMINMEYGNDMPITTMGRRIRTRLYFTSESHLHTLLNVLRFGGSESTRTPMSEEGKKICAEAPELCYLTQVIFRLFEDTSRDADDPQRYRVEVLFSPGASSTPMHMAEQARDSDSSRFDTDPLKVIGHGNLSCQEVEDFLNACITEGHTEEDNYEDASMSTTNTLRKMGAMTGATNASGKLNFWPMERRVATPSTDLLTLSKVDTAVHDNLSKKKKKSKGEKATGNVPPQEPPVNRDSPSTDPVNTCTVAGTATGPPSEPQVNKDLPLAAVSDSKGDDAGAKEMKDDEEDVDRMAKIVARQWYWRGIAVASFLVGAGCLFLSINLKDQTRHRRRFTRKH
jgi:hypothetical protein